jgi:hypothetical protein
MQKEAGARPAGVVGGAVAMARYSMYGLLVISQTLNWFTRVGMPQLIPFIVTDMALSEAQRALLMGAFFPPCAATPAPAPAPLPEDAHRWARWVCSVLELRESSLCILDTGSRSPAVCMLLLVLPSDCSPLAHGLPDVMATCCMH